MMVHLVVSSSVRTSCRGSGRFLATVGRKRKNASEQGSEVQVLKYQNSQADIGSSSPLNVHFYQKGGHKNGHNGSYMDWFTSDILPTFSRRTLNTEWYSFITL